MAIHITVVVILPIIMLIVAASPFDELINIEPLEEPEEKTHNVVLIFFIMWVIWILMLTRILYLVKIGKFRLKQQVPII